MEETTQKKAIRPLVLILAAAVLAVCIGVLAKTVLSNRGTEDINLITVSTLQKIVDVSELSTFTAVYNGIAAKPDEKKPEQIDYYVAYDATVTAGIDFKQIQIAVDEKEKTIRVVLPEVHITNISVDISSLEFMFFDKKANVSGVSEQAYKLCEEDVKEESAQQSAILELASQNAANILTALMSPIVEQLDGEYTLTIE